MNTSFSHTDLLASAPERSATAAGEPPTSGSLPPLLEPSEGWLALERKLHRPGFPRTEYERIVRIMEEFANGFGALTALPPTVVIWGSSRTRPEEPAYFAAKETARQLAQAGFGIMTGGGPGIMEAGNRGAREAGTVASVGLPMEALKGEPANGYLDVALIFRYFIARKVMFVRFAEAMVVFPGGLGTLDELFEVLLLVQLGKLHPIPIILYDWGFWRGLYEWMRDVQALSARTINEADMRLITVCDDPSEIARLVIEAYQATAEKPRAPSLYR